MVRWTHDYSLEIVSAPARVLIGGEWLEWLYQVKQVGEQMGWPKMPPPHVDLNMKPALTMHPLDEKACATWHLGVCFTGAIITVRNSAGPDYLYEVAQYDFKAHAWHAHWPD